jgi:serine/threonine protein kinase
VNLLLEPGSTLGDRYTLGANIASGGMGDVWEATDEVLQRPVAIKVLRPADPDDTTFVERFRDEARGSASLHHPNIAAVYDYGEEDDTAYIVMELVPGRTLADLIRDADGPGLDPEQARSILGQAALALSTAHKAGVVHRDVKPGNIIITPEGQAKLTDFGIARIGDGSGHTRTGEVLGTPDYISPEQALGEPATEASDLYALGVIGHEMVTGSKPFDMGTPVATALAQVHDAPPPLPDSVPDDLRRVIVACLAKKPEERPPEALAVAEVLGVPLGALPGVTPPPSALDPTTAIAAIDPTRAMTLPDHVAASPGAAGPRPSAPSEPVTPAGGFPSEDDGGLTRVPGPWLWLAVAVVALIAWAAFALGGRFGEAPGAAPTAPPPSTQPAPTTSSTTTTASTTTTSTTTTVAGAGQPPGKGSDEHKGKGKGKGRGN